VPRDSVLLPMELNVASCPGRTPTLTSSRPPRTTSLYSVITVCTQSLIVATNTCYFKKLSFLHELQKQSFFILKLSKPAQLSPRPTWTATLSSSSSSKSAFHFTRIVKYCFYPYLLATSSLGLNPPVHSTHSHQVQAAKVACMSRPPS
jgi:hypothetical protein